MFFFAECGNATFTVFNENDPCLYTKRWWNGKQKIRYMNKTFIHMKHFPVVNWHTWYITFGLHIYTMTWLSRTHTHINKPSYRTTFHRGEAKTINTNSPCVQDIISLKANGKAKWFCSAKIHHLKICILKACNKILWQKYMLAKKKKKKQ